MAPSNPGVYLPHWQVKCLTAPGPDSDLSLHVSFDNARFLFGCGEGTQRAFNQKRTTMKGLSGIFVGSGESRSRAGLAGVLMTAADAGISKVDIVGPPDMSQYLSTLRSSVIRDSITVNMRSYPRTSSTGELVKLFESPNITVHGIALIPQPVAGPSKPPSQYIPFDPHSSHFRPSRLSPEDAQRWTDQIVCDIFHNGPKARASRRPPPPGSKSPPREGSPHPANPFVNPDNTICSSIPDTRYPLPLPTPEDTQTQMVYICQAADIRGKFDVNKANALGVPKGPVRGKLTRGETIQVDDASVEGGKRVIKPEDCLVGGGPGSILIVVNCSESTKCDLLANPAFDKYQTAVNSDGEQARHVHLVVHRVPRSVWESADYKEWMKAFGERTQHLIADPVEYPDRTVFNSAAWNTLQLSIADSTIFNPPYVTSPRPPSVDLPPNTSFLVEGAFCRMHPPAPVTLLGVHDKDIPFTITKEEAESARETIRQDMPEYSIACDAAQLSISSALRAKSSSDKQIGEDIVVTTLGTGSAIPSKYRNVSSTYLEIPDLGGILLDAGEGTLGQIKRRFGKEGTLKLFMGLKMIFVSHMHADHHLGLNSVLEERFRIGVASPLYIIGPSNIALNLQESASWQYAAPDQTALRNVRFINIQRLGFKIETDFRRSRSTSPSEEPDDEPVKEALDEEALKQRIELKGRSVDSDILSPWEKSPRNPPPNRQTHPLNASSRSPSPSNRRQSRTSSPAPTSDAESEKEAIEMDQWEQESIEDRRCGRKLWPFTHVYNFSPAATRDHWWTVRRMLRDLGLSSIWAPVVPHRGRAYGLSIEHSSGWKIVYSGDTKPSEELVRAGQNATLLIHEATLEDDKPEVAAVKGHSTFSQAIDVGKRMKAKHILLNHFSQRYPKLPKLPVFTPTPSTVEGAESTEKEYLPIVSISFDFMSLRIGDMWKMQYYMEPLSLLFVEAEEEGEGEDSVIGAVRKDVNPTLDGNENGQNKNHKNSQPSTKLDGSILNEESNGQEKGKSKKEMKKDKVRLEQKGKRAASPSMDDREVKRRSTDSSITSEEKMQVDGEK
ncbi:uncharacterized protein I206_106964 [Kwoniella pini CBS 10737]|uniref:ribonuclease Z n=1 Tax=Kwoniella pini CBS 10737 TaxID=1296096 RepID=A0A1B9HZK1_9TREE|nr:uncharacterized protein I206_05494 [Kwoniella pini CBS 10737]OCF48713.1 hypothetical protein I206_05494 [Kwoniella pini CBS 10737]